MFPDRGEVDKNIEGRDRGIDEPGPRLVGGKKNSLFP